MVDYAKLRKKFPNRDPDSAKRRAKIKAIAREYEAKRLEIGGKAPVLKRGVVFYAVIVLGLMMVGALVLSALGKGGRAPISKAKINVTKSLNALAIALGRYRYHTGDYPTTAEGLALLAAKNVPRAGWNGPYIHQVVKDPWGHAYVYESHGADRVPTLYSAGPDGVAGTTDDFIAPAELFKEPFKDTSWTLNWMPQGLRGYVLVNDEARKREIEARVAAIKAENAKEAAARLAQRQAKINPTIVVTVALARYQAQKAEAAANRGENPAPIRLLTDWNGLHAEGDAVKVACETKAAQVKLYINRALSAAPCEKTDAGFVWQVPYEPGEIQVIALTADGSVLGAATSRTSSAAEVVRFESRLVPKALAEGETVICAVSAVDAEGARDVTYAGQLAISVEGPGEVLAVGTEANLVERCGETAGNAEKGELLVAVRRRFGSGDPIRVIVKGEHLPPAYQTFTWAPSDAKAPIEKKDHE